MPLSDDISALEKSLDSEKNPQKILQLFEKLKKLILNLPQADFSQCEKKAEKYLYLGNLGFGPAKRMIPPKAIAEFYNTGLCLISGVRSPLSAELTNGIACVKTLGEDTENAIQLFQEAIDIYKEQLSSDERQGMIHANLGNCYFKLLNYSKALENYELAERLCQEPENKILNIFNQVATSYRKNNLDATITNFDRALKELETLYSDSKESPLIVYLRNYVVHAVRLREAILAYFTALLQIKQDQKIIEIGTNLLNDPSLCVHDDKLIMECVADACATLEQYSAAIEYYDNVLNNVMLHTEFYTQCSEKRIKCILAYGQHLYEQNDLPNALLQFQKVTSEVNFSENNLNNLFEALTMSVDILIQQKEHDAAMKDYERASNIGMQLGKNDDSYKCKTALLHYEMVECFKDESLKLQKYCLMFRLLEELSLDELTWPIFIDATTKIGEVNLKTKNYAAAAEKLGMILPHIPTDKKEQRVSVHKNLIYALLCIAKFADANEEINKLLVFLDDNHQELKICLLVYKVHCLLKSDQLHTIEFTPEAIEQLFIIDPLVVEAKVLGYKILGDDYSSQGQYTAAVKCYQKAESLLSSSKVDINIFNSKEVNENLYSALKQTDALAALQNLLSAEDISDKYKEIIAVGLKILENRLQQSTLGSFISEVINPIDIALRKKAPAIAYEFFEVTWQRLQETVVKGIALAPEIYRELTPEEFQQVKKVQRLLIYKQSEYRGEYRDEHAQRGVPFVNVPQALLTKAIKYIALNELAVITTGVPDLGRLKTVGRFQKTEIETKSDGTVVATVSEELIKKQLTPLVINPAATVSNVAKTLLNAGFFSEKFADPELEDLDSSQPFRLFDALVAEKGKFENEKKLVNMENKQREMADMQKSIYAGQQEQKVMQAQIAADLSALREMLQQTKKRKHEDDEEDTIVRSAKLNK